MVSPLDAKAKERDIWECANQLAGYVGPDTPDRLANFLLREADAAEALARTITAQAERIAEQDLLYKALAELSEHNYRMASNRAEAAEAEVRTLRDAVRLLNLEPLVDGWHNGGAYDKHPDELGVTLSTNCGTVYALVAALRAKEP